MKEIYFDVETLGNRSNKIKALVGLLKSTAIKTSASGDSKTRFLFSDSNENSDGRKWLLPRKPAGKISMIKNGEIVAIADKLLE